MQHSDGLEMPPSNLLYTNLTDNNYPSEFVSNITSAWMATPVERAFEVRDIGNVALYRGGVLSDGILFNHGHAVPDGPEGVLMSQQGHFSTSWRTLKREEPIGKVGSSNRIYCSKPGSFSNYGHFLIDCASVLAFTSKIFPEAHFILDEPAQRIEKIYIDLIDLLKIDEKRICYISNETPTVVDSVGIPIGASVHPRYKNQEIIGGFADELCRIADAAPKKAVDILWVSRGDRSVSVGRDLQNEDELLEIARSGGTSIEVFEPWHHSLIDQIRTFRSARTVVGVMGAAMTSALFCHSGTSVIHLAPSSMTGLFYYDIARLRGLRYAEVRAREYSPKLNDEFCIHTDDFTCALKLSGKAASQDRSRVASSSVPTHTNPTVDRTGQDKSSANSTGLRSAGTTTLNQPNSPEIGAPATVIVVGVPRSGTSMVASCLRQLGVYLGNRADAAVHEDVEIATALEQRDYVELSKLISSRDSSHGTWGFKRPSAFRSIANCIDLFRNPRFVVTFRDPVAIAKRYEISEHMPFLRALRLATNQTGDLTKFVETLAHPVMLVSYEKALLDPRRLASELAAFCGIAPGAETIEKAASSVENGPEIYLRASQRKLEGRLDLIAAGFAFGWARQVGQLRPQTVVIRSGTRIVGRGQANLHRPDLAKAGKEEGNCAFKIKLDDSDLALHEVTAEIEGTVFRLKNGAVPK